MGDNEKIISIAMKQYVFLVCAVVVVISIACSRQNFVGEVPVETTADLAAVTAKVLQSKTLTHDGVNVLWENGDKIGLFVANSSTQEERRRSAVYETVLDSPSAEAVFVKADEHEAGLGNGLYYAAFPAESIARWGSQNAMDNTPTARRCYATIPVEQTAVVGGWDKTAGILAASSTNSQFSFNHATSYVKFKVADASTDFVKLTIQSIAGEPLAAIETAILYEDDNTISVSSYSDPSDNVTLSTSDNLPFENGTYYIAMMPGTYTAGLRFLFENAQGEVVTKSVEGSHTVRPGDVVVIGTVGELPFKENVNSAIEHFVGLQVPLFATTKISLLGDSISTYEGYLPPYFESNDAAYYPTGTVTSVTQQYWYKLIYDKLSDAALDVNNSWRGTTVVWRNHSDFVGKDYCARVEKYGLGDPDVVIINGGTNDCTKYSAQYSTYPNQYKANMYPGYSGMSPDLPTDAEFEAVYELAEAADTWEEIVALEDGYFIHAYVKLLNMIRFRYPDAKVVMIIGDSFTKRAQQAILKIAEHYGSLYGYKCVNFFGLSDKISKVSGVHPDDAGFTYMADIIYDQVGDYID